MGSNEISVRDPAYDAQIQQAMQALRSATWFALSEGDRYSALGRKAVANSFYNLLPMLAEVRKAMVGEPGAEASAQAGDAAPTSSAPHLRLVTPTEPEPGEIR
ncbi:hypothetical protein [Pseudomonas sp. CGJS7]|uniref:hypothetical protein n=1 Tax=Pseudomonas sp. CGJS7 TaxID=3109348 RepID=UPI00300B8F33